MGDQGKPTITSILVDGEKYKIVSQLHPESVVSVAYTQQENSGRLRHIVLNGTVGYDHGNEIILKSITDTDTGKTHEFHRDQMRLSKQWMGDKVPLVEAIADYVHDWLNHAVVKWSDVEFPSDQLSMKRLRTLFPQQFDQGDGPGSFGQFFYPEGANKCPHLVQLNELLVKERRVVEHAFRTAIDPGLTDDEDSRYVAADARKGLVKLYQHYKLADSPETARFLIQHLKEQGEQQAKQIDGRGR